MVKLIRLTTNDDNCIFDNTFNQDIQLKPNSKIALKNFSCEVDTQIFTMNTSNNTLIYTMRGTDFKKEVKLSKGVYSRSNINILLNDMTLQLNKSLTLIGASFGKQFLVSRKDAKTHIQTQIGSNNPYLDDQIRQYITYTTTNNNYKRNGGTRGTYDSFMYINKALCKGAGAVQVQLGTYPNATGNGFILGITSKSLAGATIVDIKDIDYGLYISRPESSTEAGIYKIVNGKKDDETEDIPVFEGNFNEDNEVFFIVIEEGKIKLKSYDNQEISPGVPKPPTILHEANYDGITDYYPVLIMEGDVDNDNVQLTNFFFTPDPFYTDPEDIEIFDELTSTPGPNPSRNYTAGHFFEFADEELASFLGFKNNRIPKTGVSKIKNFDIYSDFEFSPSDVSDSFYVELLNIPLQSYNADKKQRQNILHTIVNSNVNNDRVDYTAPYPLYIDINNDKPLTLRNIRARILKDDGAPVSVNGKSQLTILID